MQSIHYLLSLTRANAQSKGLLVCAETAVSRPGRLEPDYRALGDLRQIEVRAPVFETTRDRGLVVDRTCESPLFLRERVACDPPRAITPLTISNNRK